MPRTDDLPSFDVRFNGTRCTTNPLGVKGCGKAGAFAAFPAIGSTSLQIACAFRRYRSQGPGTPSRLQNAVGS